MMKSASIVTSTYYRNNKLFDLDDYIVNRDNCLYPFFMLRKKLQKYDIGLATNDIHKPESSDIVIYNEMPTQLPLKENKHKSYLILFESELIRPDNWDLQKHQYFHKIFTWNDAFVDNKKYFKINFSHLIPKNINKDLQKKEKLCAAIAGNKKVYHRLELYSKRVEAIRWFEKNHPSDFDLYGIGWDEYRFGGSKIVKALNRIKPLTQILAPKFPSYRGKVVSKKEVLEKYKFAICYENAKDIPGYITEKIFDCFFAGCVPIYWGASNVEERIPLGCFIDKRRFDSYEALYDFMLNMDNETYLGYLNSIECFLNSEKVIPFSSEYFADTIIREVTRD